MTVTARPEFTAWGNGLPELPEGGVQVRGKREPNGGRDTRKVVLAWPAFEILVNVLRRSDPEECVHLARQLLERMGTGRRR